MEKTLEWLPIGCIAAGGILYTIFSRLEIQKGAFWGICLIGAAVILFGMRDIFNFFRAHLPGEYQIPKKHTKLMTAVMLHSAALMLIGAGVLVYALLMITGWAEPVVIYLRQKPGMLWLFFGVLGCVFALSRILKPLPEQSKIGAKLSNLSSVILNGILLLISAVACAAGLIEIVSPSAYHQLMDMILARLQMIFV